MPDPVGVQAGAVRVGVEADKKQERATWSVDAGEALKRSLHIWLPTLPLDRLRRMEDVRLAGAFAMTREERGVERVTFPNTRAREEGVTAGQGLADARAICPDLLSEPQNVIREASLLLALRRWADRFSPAVALAEPDGLDLDASGVAHLFGSERELLEAVEGGLEAMQVEARAAIADTPLAARIWARVGGGGELAAGATLAACAPLPVDALETPATESLHRTGLRTIGDLMDHPTAELGRRFGLAVPDALNRLLGRRPDPLRLNALERPYAARMTLPEPIGLRDDIEAVLERLLANLTGRLERKGLGARAFCLTVACPDTGQQHLHTGFSRPTRQSAAIQRQFQRPLDELRLEFGVDRLRLHALGVEPIQMRQVHLGANEGVQDAMERLVTRLGNRLGFDRVRRPAPCLSHRPEMECESVEVADAYKEPDWPERRSQRPLRIFAPEYLHVKEAGRPPASFEWRRESYHLESYKGPERVAPQWWADCPGQLADYYAVATQEGPQLWLRRLPKKEGDWTVAGVFA